MLRKLQLLQELFPLYTAVRSPGEAQLHEVLLGDVTPGLAQGILHMGTGCPEGPENNLRGHTLYAQLSLFSRGSLPPLLAGNVGNVGMEQVLLWNGTFEKVPDYKTGSVGI